ncbi:MAG: anthranilate synthase component I, partial [Zetaproteobacteria bacterium]
LGFAPAAVVIDDGRHAHIRRRGERTFSVLDTDALGWLAREVLSVPEPPEAETLPFPGGAVGWFGWPVVERFEPAVRPQAPLPDPIGAPQAAFLLVDRFVVFDNLKGAITLCVRAESSEEAAEALDAMEARLLGHASPPPLRLDVDLEAFALNAHTEPEAFMAAVDRVREYIAAGDAFQVVLSQRFSAAASFSPFALYRAIRHINPSPYLFYLAIGDTVLVGSSPEILVRKEGGRAIVRPIAGTRRRGRTPEEDRALEAELLADEKERAEHVMLVDLGRNDLGRVCGYGTVRAKELMAIERYSHVMHIVSEIEGELMPSISALELLAATFPAGTVSGAPKVRAIQIIHELEPTSRGPYAGAVGYIGFGGARMDTAIAIRTAVVREGVVHVQAGAGIVADSVPEREQQECVNKAMALARAIALAAQQEQAR